MDYPQVKYYPKFIKSAGANKHRHPLALYSCQCGNVFIAKVDDVRRKHTRSCGCYAREVRAYNLLHTLQ